MAGAYRRMMSSASSRRKTAGPRDAGLGADIGEPAARVLRRFRLVFNAVKTHFQQVERSAGLGGAQLWALSIIHARPGLGVGELARAMDVKQSTASNLVRALAERALVDVTREAADRRVVQLRVRPAGRKLLREAPGPFSGVLPQALASLDAQTLARLDSDLAQVIAVLGADVQGAKVPLGQ